MSCAIYLSILLSCSNIISRPRLGVAGWPDLVYTLCDFLTFAAHQWLNKTYEDGNHLKETSMFELFSPINFNQNGLTGINQKEQLEIHQVVLL